MTTSSPKTSVSASASHPERICVAAIAGAHGVGGEVQVKTFTEDPRSLASFESLSNESEDRVFEIDSLRGARADRVIAKIRGVESREEAMALKGQRLYITRDQLPDLEDDESYYHADLVGCRVLLESGENFGEVVALYNFGASDVLEILCEESRETLMVPFTRQAVPGVNVSKREIILDPKVAFPPDAFLDKKVSA